MASFWSGNVRRFLDTPTGAITGTLAVAQIRHFRINEAQQLRAWEASIAMLRAALAPLPQAADWHVLLEFPMLRLGSRPDAIILTDRAILVLEFKAGARSFAPPTAARSRITRSTCMISTPGRVATPLFPSWSPNSRLIRWRPCRCCWAAPRR